MSANRSKDTKPELKVRSVLRQLGVGYRTHDRALPGTPDVSMRGRKVALFVQGCFWHSHGCRPPRRFGTNAEFWEKKLARNVERDALHREEYARMGWRVVEVWECEMRDRAALCRRLARELRVEDRCGPRTGTVVRGTTSQSEISP